MLTGSSVSNPNSASVSGEKGKSLALLNVYKLQVSIAYLTYQFRAVPGGLIGLVVILPTEIRYDQSRGRGIHSSLT